MVRRKKMVDKEAEDGCEEQRAAMQQGIVRIAGQNAVFMDSSLVVSAAYSYHCTKSERYYSRSLLFSSCESIVASPPPPPPLSPLDDSCSGSRKRKRKKKKKRLYTPNEKESFAECRHQVKLACSLLIRVPSSAAAAAAAQFAAFVIF
jgi:hypothetical protein